jgi:hypothetical protein
MKNLITLLLLAALFSCEKDNPVPTKSDSFPFVFDTVYYHSYPTTDSTDSKIVFKGSGIVKMDQSRIDNMRTVIERPGAYALSVDMKNITIHPILGFELVPSDFGISTFGAGSISRIVVKEEVGPIEHDIYSKEL